MLFSKKSQVGMIEMIMVLIIILVILIFGVYFYYKFFFTDIQQTGIELTRQQADVLLATMTSLPEFQCSFRATSSDCLDMLKLSLLNQFMSSHKDYYTNLFGYKTISIKQIYPTLPQEKICQTGEIPPSCNKWAVYSKQRSNSSTEIISTPVSLFNPVTKSYSIGKLIIEVYK